MKKNRYESLCVPAQQASRLRNHLLWIIFLSLAALTAAGCDFKATGLEVLRLTRFASAVDLTTEYTVAQVDADESFQPREMLVGVEFRLGSPDGPPPANSLSVQGECFATIVDPALGSLRGDTRALTLSSGPSSLTLREKTRIAGNIPHSCNLLGVDHQVSNGGACSTGFPLETADIYVRVVVDDCASVIPSNTVGACLPLGYDEVDASDWVPAFSTGVCRFLNPQ